MELLCVCVSKAALFGFFPSMRMEGADELPAQATMRNITSVPDKPSTNMCWFAEPGRKQGQFLGCESLSIFYVSFANADNNHRIEQVGSSLL